MSRKKNSTLKAMAGEPVGTKAAIATYGWKWNFSAWRFVNNWDQIFRMDDSTFRKKLLGRDLTIAEKAKWKRIRREAWAWFEQKLRLDIESGNGAFFRQLADAIELRKRPVDPVRSLLLRDMLSADPISPQSKGDIIEHIKAMTGLAISPRQLDRILKEIGFPSLHGKQGRPKKSDNNRGRLS